MRIPEPSQVVVRSWKGKLAAYVPGPTAARPPSPTTRPRGDFFRGPNAQVGVGGSVHDNVFVVRYLDVTRRRLIAPPAARPVGDTPEGG